MASLWDCEKCGYNHYEPASECKNCGTESNLPDMVNHPPHYKDASGIECIEVTKYMSFLGGNCFKYLYRAGKKGSTIEDLKKAAWYADKAWENEEVVLIAPMRLIEKIAVHREGNIKQAMLYVAEDFWAMAKRVVEDEIARLESE